MDISFEQVAIAIAIQLHISCEEAEQLLAAVLEYTEVSAELDVALHEYLPNYERWLKVRNDSIAKLEELADDLDTHHENVNIANLTASSVGAAGGALAVTGAVLSFFTFGLAAPLAFAGTAMAVTGGVTSIGATLAEYGITKDRCSDAQKIYDDDMKQTEQIVEILDKIGELTERFEAILVVLEEFESVLTDTCSSDVECQSEEGVMPTAEGNGLGPSADVECLAKQDQATQENQGTGVGVSGAVQSRGDKLGGVTEGRENQKLMALKSSSSAAGMAYQAKSIKILAGRGERSGSAALGGVMVGGAVFGAGALVIGARLHPKLMKGVGKAGKVALPKVAGSVVRVSKLAGNVGQAGKAAKFAGTMGKMGKIGSVGTSAAKVGRVGLKIGGAALSAVSLGFDIWSIVSTAKDMSEGSKSPAGVQLRARSREIRKQRKRVSEFIEKVEKYRVLITVVPPAALSVYQLVRYLKSLKSRGEKNDSDPKKGHHVINNDTRRVLPKIIDEFIKKNRYFSGKSKYADLEDKVSKTSRVHRAYEQPLPKDVEQAIETELVVYTPPNETHHDDNALVYGFAIEQLRKEVVSYMNRLFEEMVENKGEILTTKSGRANIKSIVDIMNDKEIYVDHQALEWWLNGGGSRAKYERCRDYVAKMFRQLHSREILMWVSELYWVYKEMNP